MRAAACVFVAALLLATAAVRAQEEIDFGEANELNTPHGGVLKNLIADEARAEELIKVVSPTLPSLILTQRQLCDIEMLLSACCAAFAHM